MFVNRVVIKQILGRGRDLHGLTQVSAKDIEKADIFNLVFWKHQGGKLLCGTWGALHEVRQYSVQQGHMQGPVRGRMFAVGTRKQIIANAAAIFSPKTLLQQPPEPIVLQRALAFLSHRFGKLIWGFSADQELPYKSVPAEARKTPDVPTLVQQYHDLRRLLVNVKNKSPYLAHVPRGKPVPEILLHVAALQVKYSIVQKVCVWNILRLWHRVLLYSFDKETLCEFVGSHMRFVEKKHATGRPLAPKALVRATRLRIAGIRGTSAESPFLHRCLARHMELQSKITQPRFFVSDRTQAARMQLDLAGPSFTLHRLRQGLGGGSISNPHVAMYPWLVGPIMDPKSEHLAKKLSVRLPKHRRAQSTPDEDPYEPDALVQMQWEDILPHLQRIGLIKRSLPRQPLG